MDEDATEGEEGAETSGEEEERMDAGTCPGLLLPPPPPPTSVATAAQTTRPWAAAQAASRLPPLQYSTPCVRTATAPHAGPSAENARRSIERARKDRDSAAAWA